MIGGIIKALLEWLTDLFRTEIRADKTASDGDEIPSHIRERLSRRLREHPGGLHRIRKAERDHEGRPRGEG